ncbi:MAG TPA: S1 RNA-binding domain-containing protein [Caldilineaceae bacterium]|nr:S1 RNA-binding domain-containing protein [Caldilineaceae bacterium]
MALLLEQIEQSLLEPTAGEIRTGVIVDKRPHEILVDIGYKSEGIVNGREIERIGDMLDTLKVGDEVPVYVLREDKDGNLLLSISRAQAEKDWERAEQLMESQQIFESCVAAYNRGGVIVKIGQVRGFVPASQLSADSQSQGDDSVENADDRWANLVGENLMLKVIDIDRKRNRLILSERLAVREWRRQQKEQLLDTLKEGDTYDGVISSIADFGAFVDLGGADGLIHLSELSWNRVSHPSEVVKVGDKIKVQILSVDQERRRIGLSLRRLQPQPWDVVEQTYEVGQIVRGRITKLVNFGAFARLEKDGIEGLIHVSELTDKRITHPREVVAEGEEYDLRIIRIDTDKRRMGLSLKQAQPADPALEIDWQVAPSNDAESNSDGETVEPAAVEAEITAASAAERVAE